jgi:DNA-directed RNA polymerase subunit M/transcription elongation factor TFIIS
MLSNCPQCGSALTIKEAIKEGCKHCSGNLKRASVLRFAQKPPMSSSFLKDHFDQLISEELKKGNLLPAA